MHVTKPLSNRGKRETHTNSKSDGFMKYVVEMGTGNVIYEVGSDIQI
jgi:hypothetical protein